MQERDVLMKALRESVAQVEAERALRASAEEMRAILEVEPENRTIFVGYPYALPKDDYRGVFSQVAEEYGVTFVFADEELTNEHILVKIETMMAGAAFSLFDITLWNPNVALELGIAYGHRYDYYILFDPSKGNPDVLSDVRGIDRIEYRSYAELKRHLSKLIRDQFGAPVQEQKSEARDVVAQMVSLRTRIPELLEQDPGQPIGGIANALGVPLDLAQTLVRPLIGTKLETRGVRRGMRYWVLGQAPSDEPPDDHVDSDPEGAQ